MQLSIQSFSLDLSLMFFQHGLWLNLPLVRDANTIRGRLQGVDAQLQLREDSGRIVYTLSFNSSFRTRVRLKLDWPGQSNYFHLIPANIHGDNNAAHARPGEYPVLASDRPFERNRSPLWEFRADRAPVPVSILCSDAGAVGISIDPYSDSDETPEKFIRNGLFASLPGSLGVATGYGNDPMTFFNKTVFLQSSADLVFASKASGRVYAIAGKGRLGAHDIVRDVYAQYHEIPTFKKTYKEALRALADTFSNVNYAPEHQQYTNRFCLNPIDKTMKPWRAIGEIGWTGGSMLAFPFRLTETIFPGYSFPKTPATIFDEICSGYNEQSGFIKDNYINHYTQNRPEKWNPSDTNGWWSGFLPQTKDNHIAYTNAHAAYYLLASRSQNSTWISTALKVLDTAIALQREDGAFGYVFSSQKREVIDWEGYAGVWFAAALPLAFAATGDAKYLESAKRAMRYYHTQVRDLAAWGSPMDTYKSVDSEGNLGFVRAARLLHQVTSETEYLAMLQDGAHYEYLWRYAYRTRQLCPPLAGSNWNSCGGSITSISNPHIHPMSIVITRDLEYLAEQTNDSYHQNRADDGMAWIMNTMELYPDVTGYGCYGLLSERTCPSDGLLSEKFHDTGAPSSTWWSYNAWAAGSAMEAIAEQILAGRSEPK